jgi:uncharacterized membrane protein YjgN (DUF898 family)
MQSEPNLTPVTPITYDGTRGALTALFYKNLALSIVTFGVYRFWAITNMRAFLWQHWKVVGEPFDYSGTGKELFIGFLKVAVALLMLSTAAQIGQVTGAGEVVQVLIAFGYTAFVFLLYVVGSYLGLRYRMARTRWCSVAFVQGGTLKGYLGLMLLGWFLCIVTLGLYLPWFQVKRARYIFNHLSFGSLTFKQAATAQGLLARLFDVVILTVMAIVIAVGLFIVTAKASGSLGLLQEAHPAVKMLPATAVSLLVIFVGYSFAASLYQRKLTQNVAEGLSLGPLRFRFDASAGQYFRLSFGNLLLVWLSLGLLYPLATHRTQMFWAQHLTLLGSINPAEIEQAARRAAGSEGFTGFLGDMGAGFGG